MYRESRPMKCRQCQHVNPQGWKFCGECGTSLSVSEGPAPAAPEAYTPPHLAEKILASRAAIEGERKPVTVLFCDVVRSTALAEQLGAERMHGLLSRFFEVAIGE